MRLVCYEFYAFVSRWFLLTDRNFYFKLTNRPIPPPFCPFMPGVFWRVPAPGKSLPSIKLTCPMPFASASPSLLYGSHVPCFLAVHINLNFSYGQRSLWVLLQDKTCSNQARQLGESKFKFNKKMSFQCPVQCSMKWLAKTSTRRREFTIWAPPYPSSWTCAPIRLYQ